MPLIRCSKCGQAYDVPPAVAVRLPTSIATCSCGEWLSGSKAAVLARLTNPDDLRQVDMSAYRVASQQEAPQQSIAEDVAPRRARNVRIVARGAHESIDRVYTIFEHPLLIGRRGCHIEMDEAELSIRHCSISVRGDELVLRDEDSYTGTFLDGREVEQAVIEDGVHIVRAGAAVISIEPTQADGLPVVPIFMPAVDALEESAIARTLQARRTTAIPQRPILICVEGSLAGQEFEIPPTGLVVGREGHVRVPDEYLSRRHFEVKPDADGIIRVQDLGSRNGTFLNTLPAQNTKVLAGDEIRAGVNRFRIELRV